MENVNLLKIEDSQFSLHSTQDILLWLEERKINLEVCLDRISLSECEPWYYDTEEGMIRNKQGTFFQIIGIRHTKDNGEITEQPIILPDSYTHMPLQPKSIE